MSRRNIFLLAGILSAAGVSLGFFVPSFLPSPTQGLVKKLRSCLDATSEEWNDDDMQLAGSEKIQVRLLIAALNISKTRTNLLADDENAAKAVCGVVKDDDRLHMILQRLRHEGCLKLFAEPTISTMNGRPARVMSGGEVPIRAAGDGAVIEMKEFGTSANMLPILRKDGRIHLQLEVTLSQPKAHIDLSKGVAGDHEFDIVQAKASLVLKDEQTGFIGGMKRKDIDRSAYHVPGFSELPGIGSCLVFPREVEIDEELLILVTPKLVSDSSLSVRKAPRERLGGVR
jgi:Flp pilus assembly secretin CpaC